MEHRTGHQQDRTVRVAPFYPEDAILQLRIELLGLEPLIWRRVRIPGNITLGQLHQVIQIAMGWTDSHLHEFIIGSQHYGDDDPDPDLPHEIIGEATSRLNVALALVSRKTLTYLYDYGDAWEHQLTVEKMLVNETLRHPICEAGENACPPEDVGGLSGYAKFIEAIVDPTHSEHQDMLDWCGGSFDPRAFDIYQINQQLQRIKL